MKPISRRTLLGTSALAAAGVAAGCSGGSGNSGGGGGPGVDWWDHFSSFQELNDGWAERQAQQTGATITHTYHDASKAPQAFQLAHQSKQMPDVYSNVIGLPLPALVEGKWVHELKIADDVLAKIPENSLTEGITSLDGKLYGFPLFSFRQSSSLLWLNKELFTKAGLDPAAPPTDYASFRQTCQKLSAADVPPLTLALGGDGARVGDQVEDLVQPAGFPGYEGLDFTTGEYAYHHDAYIEVIEFLKELYAAKLMLPGTNNLEVVDARTRFASGAVAMFIDGIWCAGGAKALVPEFVDKIGVGSVLVPQPGDEPWCYRGRPSAGYFVSADSDQPDVASELVASMMTEEYQQGMIAAMDQPPLDLDLVQKSEAIDAYKQAVAFCAENVFLMPQAIVKNPEIAVVDAKRKPVTPTIGNVVQGYLGGSITDLPGALKKLSDASEADREQAIKSAKSDGAKVSVDDYVFSDWKPGKDYTGKTD